MGEFRQKNGQEDLRRADSDKIMLGEKMLSVAIDCPQSSCQKRSLCTISLAAKADVIRVGDGVSIDAALRDEISIA